MRFPPILLVAVLLAMATFGMTTRQIEDLPLNGRNYLDLAKLLSELQSKEKPNANHTLRRFVICALFIRLVRCAPDRDGLSAN